MRSLPLKNIQSLQDMRAQTAALEAALAPVVGAEAAHNLQGFIGPVGWSARAFSDSVSLNLDWITPAQAAAILKILLGGVV